MEEILLAVAIALAIFLAAVVIKAAGNLATESSLIALEEQLDFGAICNGFGCADFSGLSPPMEAMRLLIFTPKNKQGPSPETGTMTKYG